MLEWVIAVGFLYAAPSTEVRVIGYLGGRYESREECLDEGANRALEYAVMYGAGGAVVFCESASEDQEDSLLNHASARSNGW